MSEISEYKKSFKTQWVRHSTASSVAVNLFLAGMQMSVGVHAHSYPLIAESLHSLSDLLSDAVVFWSSSEAQKEPSASYPYGYHRIETLTLLFLGAFLIFLGAQTCYEGFLRFSSGSFSPPTKEVFFVIVVSLCGKELLFRYLYYIALKVQSSLLLAYAWHARTDAASCCIVSLGAMGHFWGYPICDFLSASVVGGMIMKMGWIFFSQAIRDLSDQAAPADKIEKIRAIFETTPGVLGVHDLRSRMSGDYMILDVHLEIQGTQSVRDGHAIAVEARKRVMSAFPILSCMTHVDPV